jgi:type I restriction enzyme S subunit
VTEVGVIPEDWDIKKVGDIAFVSSGGTPNTKIIEYWNGKIRWMNSGELNLKRVYEVKGRITELGLNNSSTKIIPKNSILIGLAGQGKTRGTAAINYVDLCINQSIAAIYPSHFYDSEFLYQNINSRYDELRSMSTGDGGRGGLNLKIIRELQIHLPTLSEQKAIAEALSETDNLILSLEKMIDKKKKIKQGAMQQLLNGKKRLSGFSGEWEVKKLGEVADIRTGKRNNQDKVSDGLYPFFVRSQDVERINTYSYDGEAVLVPGEGGIGNIFHYINGKFEVHQRVYKISDFLNVSGKYVYYYMKQSFGAHAMKNTVKATVDSLRLPTFQEFELKIPNNFEEQKAIAQVLSDMDLEIKALEEKLEKVKTIKQGMMQELLTGRIRLI